MARTYKTTVTSDAYRKGVNLNRRLKREADKIDAQLKEARKHWWDEKTDEVPPLLVKYNIDPDQTPVQLPTNATYAAINNRMVTPVGDFNVPPAMIAEGAD